MSPEDNYKVPTKMQVKYDEIVAITDEFCAQHLDDEYRDLCRRLTAKLARKRPSPLERGKTLIWAGAILYIIGRVNFLFDQSQSPHVSAEELCGALGVSQSTAGNKATQIMDMFNMMQMDPDWTLPSLIDQNPLAWMISVNGFVMDARHAPREIQEEAYRLGLIPYLPAASDEE
jgi:hypothetical protein